MQDLDMHVHYDGSEMQTLLMHTYVSVVQAIVRGILVRNWFRASLVEASARIADREYFKRLASIGACTRSNAADAGDILAQQVPPSNALCKHLDCYVVVIVWMSCVRMTTDWLGCCYSIWADAGEGGRGGRRNGRCETQQKGW